MSTSIITDAEALAFLRIPSTVVDQDSASGQAILYGKDTINFVVGDEIIIGRGTAREEIKSIGSIQSGVSLTTTVNLTYAHTALQADTIEAEYQDATVISGMVKVIDKLVKNHCGRCFNKETGSIEYLDGDGTSILWLGDYPVANLVLHIDYDLDGVFDSDDLISSDDYEVYPEVGKVHLVAGFPAGYRNVKATYDKGFDDADMPEDLKFVCKTEVKLLYKRWKEDSRGLKSYSVAGITKRFDPDLSSLSIMILNGSYTKKRA